jgi:surfactin family lipopeptide synthetase A
MERFREHFLQILKIVLARPRIMLQEIDMLTKAEKQQLLIDFNDTGRPFNKDILIHELFEERALVAPQSVALLFRDERMTYGELNERANRLAHALRAIGAGPGCYIGLAVDRSIDLVVSMLGILKAGAAYVPLEPKLPEARVQHILSTLALKAFVTQRTHEPKVRAVAAATPEMPVLTVDELDPEYGVENIGRVATPRRSPTRATPRATVTALDPSSGGDPGLGRAKLPDRRPPLLQF